MSSIVVLDARPLSQICHPRKWEYISNWYKQIVASGRRVVIAEITDYETRRGLLKEKATRQIEELDALVDSNYYAPLSTSLIHDAARVWAEAMSMGMPLGPLDGLNADAILIAQAQAIGDKRSVTVVTQNTGHFDPFVNAVWWENFEP